MNARIVNVICLLLLITLSVVSLVLWHDGKLELAIYSAVWALLAPTLFRSLMTL